MPNYMLQNIHENMNDYELIHAMPEYANIKLQVKIFEVDQSLQNENFHLHTTHIEDLIASQ